MICEGGCSFALVGEVRGGVLTDQSTWIRCMKSVARGAEYVVDRSTSMGVRQYMRWRDVRERRHSWDGVLDLASANVYEVLSKDPGNRYAVFVAGLDDWTH